jgi:hypothetical protein
MNKSIFLAGFGISVVLVAVCMWYTFASPLSLGVLASFDVAHRDWYVHQPPIFNACVLTFAILNFPVILAWWGLQVTLDAIAALPPRTRAMVTFGSWIVLSGAWWALIAKWCDSRKIRT